jgi:hypothetical protein
LKGIRDRIFLDGFGRIIFKIMAHRLPSYKVLKPALVKRQVFNA